VGDIFHKATVYIVGEVNIEDVKAAARLRWKTQVNPEHPYGPMARIGLFTGLRAGIWEEFVPLLGGDSTHTLSVEFRGPPWDEESREAWAGAIGTLLELVADADGCEAWLLTTDEWHPVGYWRRDHAGLNSTMGWRARHSLRVHAAVAVIDHFEAREIDYAEEDLGDLPGGVSTDGDF